MDSIEGLLSALTQGLEQQQVTNELLDKTTTELRGMCVSSDITDNMGESSKEVLRDLRAALSTKGDIKDRQKRYEKFTKKYT